MDRIASSANPLARGFYTVTDAARLIEVGSVPRIKAWLRGYPGRRVGPLLHRDYPPGGKTEELSFLDLIEVRFVEHFREQGVRLTTLRRALETAREVFNEDKPLATDRITFVPRSDGRDIFVEDVLKPAARETDDRTLLSLVTRQFEIYRFMQDRLARGITFDRSTHLASRWVPRPKFPTIVIDPGVAYGQPIGPHLVPTGVLHAAWVAEDGDVAAVADWYDVPVDEVQVAIAFEASLQHRLAEAAA